MRPLGELKFQFLDSLFFASAALALEQALPEQSVTEANGRPPLLSPAPQSAAP